MDLTDFNATLGRNNLDEKHFLYLNDGTGNIYYAPATASVPGAIYSSSSYQEFAPGRP